jgi:hypothetical protein
MDAVALDRHRVLLSVVDVVAHRAGESPAQRLAGARRASTRSSATGVG